MSIAEQLIRNVHSLKGSKEVEMAPICPLLYWFVAHCIRSLENNKIVFTDQRAYQSSDGDIEFHIRKTMLLFSTTDIYFYCPENDFHPYIIEYEPYTHPDEVVAALTTLIREKVKYT